jgi:hypothetical protein
MHGGPLILIKRADVAEAEVVTQDENDIRATFRFGGVLRGSTHLRPTGETRTGSGHLDKITSWYSAHAYR